MSIVYSQGLRVKRMCSEKEDFLKHMREMKYGSLNGAILRTILDHSESSRRTNKDKRVCLVATYRPLQRRIFNRHLDLLYSDQKLKGFLHLVRWVRFVVQGKLAAI